MSLLLKALQRASKSRDTLPRMAASGTDRGGSTTLELEPGDIEPAATERRDFDFPDRGRATPRSDAPDDEGVGIGIDDAGGRGRVLDWIRDHPVHTFAAAALLFLLLYAAYVYVVINHPTLLTRSASAPVARTAFTPPPAPPRESPTATTASSPQPNPLPPAPLPELRIAPEPPPPSQVPLPAPEAPAGVAARPTAVPPPQPVPRAPVAAAQDAAPRAEPLPRPAPPRTRPTRPPAVGATNAPLQEGVQVRSTDAGDHQAARLAEAYDALQRQDTARADALYSAAMASDPRNVDALLGMATVAWRQGRTEVASDYYYKVLQLDPQNAAAQAGLIGMVGRVDPVSSETRLKQLIDREPSGFLYAALGHLHASQDQWAPAQQAYFQAFQMEPANPDYAYNLAVGLEHLGQRKIALGYYRKALDLARARGQAGFDQKLVAARVEKLGAAVE